MSNQNITIHTNEIASTQNWTTDPDLVAIGVTKELLEKAEKAIAFMNETGIDYVVIFYALSYDLFQNVDNADDQELQGKDVREHDGDEFVVFEPEYRIEGAHARIDKYGKFDAVLQFKDSSDELSCALGTHESLVTLLNSEANAVQ